MWWGRLWLILRPECRPESSPMSSKDTAAVSLTSLPEFRGLRPINTPHNARTSSRDPRGWTTCVIRPRAALVFVQLLVVGKKTPSMFFPKRREMRNASGREGSYFPVSSATMV